MTDTPTAAPATTGPGTAATAVPGTGTTTPQVVTPVPEPPKRTAFIDQISEAYSDCGKSVIILSGNRSDLFSNRGSDKFLDLERTVYQEFAGSFNVVRYDVSSGITTFCQNDMRFMNEAVAESDALTAEPEEKMGNFAKNVKATAQDPLMALNLLRDTLQGVATVRATGNKKVKPILVIVRFAGSAFPAGDWDRMNMEDRKRVVTFLSMIEAPWFRDSPHLILLLADTNNELNGRIAALPTVHPLEIDLPKPQERYRFINTYRGGIAASGITFESSLDTFTTDTMGLTLCSVASLLELSRRTKRRVTRLDVLAEINARLRADMGEMITFSRPEHSPDDIIGYKHTSAIFQDIFRRCEDPKTAVPCILVSGANGTGKTFQLEAHAARSGRVVIELKGLRGKYFGETDAAFDKLRLRLRNYNKVLILVDEAHTALGSVHKGDTHETEKRLAGNFIKLMGDPTMFGKVLWGLMTSRPDELDPDVKSRAPIQIPIFDLDGEERITFVSELFGRKKIVIAQTELDEVLTRTANYSARDYSFLVKEVLGSGNTSVLKTLDVWQASASILRQRRFQSLIAAQHCSYPALIPSDIKELMKTDQYEEEIQTLKYALKL